MSRLRPRKALASIAVLGLAAALPLAGCGGSSVPADFTASSTPPVGTTIDTGPAGPSVGDTLVFHARVLKDGKPFGYVYGTKVLVAMPGEFGAPKGFGRYQNQLSFVLPDGEITVTGTQDHPTSGLMSAGVPVATRAISGGTGAYAGVTGVQVSTQVAGKGRTLQFDFAGN